MNVFDFDKTIYKNDSTADFFFFSLRRHPKIFLVIPSVFAAFVRFYIFRKGTKTQFKETVYKFLKYIDCERDVNDFWEKNKHKIKEFYKNIHRDDDVIISASPEFLLLPICRELSVKHLIASKVNPKSGKYTGINCHGEEKVARFQKELSIDEIENFYSDSLSDTPMALLAKKAYLVKGENLNNWIF